jgi:DNA repair protein RadC
MSAKVDKMKKFKYHPSGSFEPSPEDIDITARLKSAGEILGIRLLDHIVFNQKGYSSFLESGLL